MITTVIKSYLFLNCLEQVLNVYIYVSDVMNIEEKKK